MKIEIEIIDFEEKRDFRYGLDITINKEFTFSVPYRFNILDSSLPTTGAIIGKDIDLALKEYNKK